MTVTPRSSGDLLTAAIFNGKIEAPLLLTEIPDLLLTAAKLAAGAVTAPKLAVMPTAILSKGATQSIATSAYTPVTFAGETVDTDTIHDLVTNTDRLTCRTAGLYLVSGALVFAASAAGSLRIARWYLNGAANVYGTLAPMGAGDTTVPVTWIFNLAVNDYLTLNAFQNAGVALDVTAECRAFITRLSS